MSGTPQAVVRPPTGAIVVLALLSFAYAGGAMWAFRHLPGPVLALCWLVVALLFGATAGLLAARRRLALPAYWTAFAMLVVLRVAIALGRVEPPHPSQPKFVELFVLGMLITIGLSISRRAMRETLR